MTSTRLMTSEIDMITMYESGEPYLLLLTTGASVRKPTNIRFLLSGSYANSMFIGIHKLLNLCFRLMTQSSFTDWNCVYGAQASLHVSK
jgi:hypothetical protein